VYMHIGLVVSSGHKTTSKKEYFGHNLHQVHIYPSKDCSTSLYNAGMYSIRNKGSENMWYSGH
jgi:hypothetical protein